MILKVKLVEAAGVEPVWSLIFTWQKFIKIQTFKQFNTKLLFAFCHDLSL